MEDYERYITVKEAADRLQRSEFEVWRMLESGVLPAVLRGEISSKSGEQRGFDYALLPVEGVRRVVDHCGDDFTLVWEFCGGLCQAECFPARKSSIRVFWLPEFFPELLPPGEAFLAAITTASNGPTPPRFNAAQKAAIVDAYKGAGGLSVSALARKYVTSRRTIDDVLIKAGVKGGSPRKGALGRTKRSAKTAWKPA